MHLSHPTLLGFSVFQVSCLKKFTGHNSPICTKFADMDDEGQAQLEPKGILDNHKKIFKPRR